MPAKKIFAACEIQRAEACRGSETSELIGLNPPIAAMAGLRRALSCLAIVAAAAAAVRLTYKPNDTKNELTQKDCLSANWGAAAVKGNAAVVAAVPRDVVTSARATSLDASGSFLARGAVETRRLPNGNVLAVAKGHPGATSIHVQLFADYSSQQDALRDPKRVDDNEPLPFLGVALADVTLKLPSRRPSTAKDKLTKGQHSLAIQAQKALKDIKDDACDTPRWVATDKAIFGRKDRRPACGYESFFAPYRKTTPITRAYTQTCGPLKTLTMTNLGQCVRDVIFAGDSIMRHVSFFLQCELGRKHRVSYTPLRGTSMNVSAHVEQLRKAPPQKTLVINVAGLWQVAYGRSDSYESAVEQVLRFASQKFHRVVLASTTQVFPEHFLGRSACPRAGSSIKLQGAHRAVDVPLSAARAKRAMTSLRVERANAAAARAAARVGVALVDVYAPSSLAFDDPLEAGDMRHFGSATTAAVARLLVEAACPGVLK